MPTVTEPPPRSRKIELRLGTGVFLGAASFLAIIVGTGIAYGAWKASRVAEERIHRDLAAVPAIVSGWAASQADARRSQVRSLVEESGTKALLGEGGASAETAHDSALAFARSLGAGAVFLFDARGHLISRSDGAVGEEEGRDFSGVSWVRDPLLELEPATAYILDVRRKRTLALVASAPVTQGERSELKLNGVLAGAFPVDDEHAREVGLLVSGDAVFLANFASREARTALEPVASSGRLKGADVRNGVAAVPEAVRALFVEGKPYGPFELSLPEGVWVATALPIATGRGEPVAALVVARSKTAELAAFQGIRRGISVVGLAIFLISFPLSFLLARRASRPIEELAEAAAAIGSGRAPERLPRSRWKEVGALTRAFGSMIGELARRDSERRRAEAVTAGWKNRYEAAVLASGQVLYDWEPETNAVTFGGSTERILGEPPAELTGGREAWEARVHPEDLAAFRAETEHVVSTKDPFHLEYRIRRSDGEYVCVRDEGFFVRQAAGERPRVVGFVVDVTQERRLAEHVKQSQRIDAVGRLAGGVAHDFNNLLTVIQGTASMVLARCGPEDDALKEDVTEILRASERATMLTRQLLAFSRRQARQAEALDLSVIVHDMERMLRRLIGESVALETSLADRLAVRVDRTEMEQVVMNLVVNARDALPKGGRITIETASSDEPAPPGSGARGAWATLTVHDTGKGMPPEVKSRLFEPFFTTKPAGKGTGLGLATVYAIVRESEGFVTVDSEPDKGTTFRVFLPLAAATSDAAALARAAEPAPRGTERVLVVEDEDAVRRLAARTLAQQGYEVLVASSGAEALELASRKDGAIHLVLSDVMMPGMNGAELARALEELLPGVPMLFMSGHTDDALKEEGFDFGRVTVLRKPLAQGELARRVRERLDARHA